MNKVYNFDSNSTEKYVPIEDACCDVNITKTIAANNYSALVFPFDITSKEQFESNFGTTKYSILQDFFLINGGASAYLGIYEKEDYPILAGTPIRIYVTKAVSTISFRDVHLHSELPQYTILNSGEKDGYEGDYLKRHWIIENYWYKHLMGEKAQGIKAATGNLNPASATANLQGFSWKADVIEKYVNEGAELRPYLKYYIANNNLYLKDNGSILNIFGVTQKTYIDETTPVRVYTDNTYTPYNFGNVIKVNKPEFVVYTKSENPKMFAEFEKQFTPEYSDGITTRELDNFITFEDSAVKEIIVNKFGTNGEITFKQAAQVTNEQLEGLFNGNTTITKFNEFVFFTGITKISISDDSNLSKTKSPFYGCANLQEITLPETVTDLGYRAFDQCKKVTKINLNNIVRFGFCSGQNLGATSKLVIKLPSYMEIYGSNTSIFSNVYGFELIEGSHLHINCLNGKSRRLLSCWATDGSSYSGGKPFSVTLEAETIDDHTFYYVKNITNIEFIGVKQIINGTQFTQCERLKKIIIPDTCESLQGEDMFIDSSSVEEIKLPVNSKCTTIPSKCFSNLKKYTDLYIPDNFTTIAYGAFGGGDVTKKLKRIYIGTGITSIGDRAFSSSHNLVEVVIKAITPPTLHQDAFKDCSDNFKIYVPKASVEAYKAASVWSGFADRIFGI